MINIENKELFICQCGSNIWNIQAIFENGAMALYFNNMTCTNCGVSIATSNKLDGGVI